MKNIKLDWNDITIVPETLSTISSRSEINPYLKEGNLPLFTAPMDTVIDDSNYHHFVDSRINICFPRHVKYDVIKSDDHFYSYGLDELISLLDSGEKLPKKVLIDVANGHMLKLYETAKRIKENYDIELMVGNIANPETYKKYCEIGVDYIRVGIGGGSACTTSANVGVHYPMASLIKECAEYKVDFENPTKIIADGGFKNYADIIKALALGADYVMIGSLFNKCLESCSKNYIRVNPKLGPSEYREISRENALTSFKEGVDVYKYYRGMSTKEVQKSWNRKELKTGEGITKYNLVESTLEGWIENFTDYLKSQMSYVGSRNLEEFIGQVQYVQISENAFKRFNK
jgi:IMP dehydrogenase/GMP reductase